MPFVFLVLHPGQKDTSQCNWPACWKTYELLSNSPYEAIHPISVLLAAMLMCGATFILPPFTLSTVLQRLQPEQRRAFTTPTSWPACHCNVKWARPNAVDRLSWTLSELFSSLIYQPIYAISLLLVAMLEYDAIFEWTTNIRVSQFLLHPVAMWKLAWK